jgi:beta-glucosidase
VQIYVATEAGPVRRPVRELRAFTKVQLEPGQSRTVGFDLDRRAFAYWDIEQSAWVVPHGDYRVQVCENAAAVVVEQTVTLAGDPVDRELTLDSTIEEWFTHPDVGPTLADELTADMTQEQRGRVPITPGLVRGIGSMPMQKMVGLLGDGVPPATIERLMARSRVRR